MSITAATEQHEDLALVNIADEIEKLHLDNLIRNVQAS